MYVVYTCDDSFVWIMGISMISLFENNREMDDLRVYLLGDNIGADNKAILKQIADGYGRTCTIIDVPDLNIPKSLISTRWPKSAFTRMFSGDLIPQKVKKILYLDCDIIINGSIALLETWNTDGFAVTAVKDCVSRQYKKKIGIADEDSYINAGVFLMDVDKMRQLDIRKMMAEFIDSYEGLVNYADQDILNGIFKGKFGILPPEYDVMTLTCVYTYNQICQIRRPSHYYSRDQIESAIQNPIIIHYTACMLNIRPWLNGSKHPLKEVFDKYYAISPWKGREKGNIKFNQTEHKVQKILFLLPSFLLYRVIGLVHAFIRPIVIMAMARIKKQKG